MLTDKVHQRGRTLAKAESLGFVGQSDRQTRYARSGAQPASIDSPSRS
jgi:hypothetical protein